MDDLGGGGEGRQGGGGGLDYGTHRRGDAHREGGGGRGRRGGGRTGAGGGGGAPWVQGGRERGGSSLGMGEEGEEGGPLGVLEKWGRQGVGEYSVLQ